MLRFGRIPSLLALSVALCLAAGAAPATAKSDGAEKGITEMNLAAVAALNGGDAAALAGCYTEGAMMLPPGSGPVTGREGIEEYWKEAMASGMSGLELESDEIESQGDTAYEIGRYRVFNAAGDNIDTGKYVVVWKRVKGTWYLHRDIWNTSQ